MFTTIVGGPIDPFIAGVALAAGFLCICVFATAYIVNRKSRRELDKAHELAIIKQHDAAELATASSKQAHEERMAALGFRKDVDLAQANAGLLTSHSRVDEG